MAFPLTDIRIPAITAYLAELHARASGIMPPLLPGQHAPADITLTQILVDTLKDFSIEYESEISHRYMTPAIQQAFEARVAQAINEMNHPRNTKNIVELAQDIFAFVQQQDSHSQQDNKNRFARESARGETYLQKLIAGRAHGTMLDVEAVSALLESAHLPQTIGHYETNRQNGNPLLAHDLEAIRKELTGYTDTAAGPNPVVVAPKDYVIVSLSQDNIHWYGNIYHLVNGQATALYAPDYDYAMGDNTCGISAVAKSLQELQTLVPGYVTNLPAPDASAAELSAGANRLLLGRNAPINGAVPATKPKHQNKTLTDLAISAAIQEQARLLAIFSKDVSAQGKSVAKDSTAQWEKAHAKQDSKTKLQYEKDRELAIRLAVEELELPKPRR